MEFFVISLLNGLTYGLLLFMLSSGLTLIFSMMGVLNFAHASFYMLGAYFAYQISTAIGFWPALVVAPLLLGLVGAMLERYGLRTVHKAGHVAELLFTVGVALLIEEIVPMIWGRTAVDYVIPGELDFTLFTLFSTSFPAYRGFMLLISIGMMILLYIVLTRTRIGIIIQAALTHPEMVSALGHNVPRVFMLVFGVGTALAGLAGVIGGNAFVTEPSMAAGVGSIVFVIAVVGGLGSLEGAFIASVVLGIIQTFSVALDYSISDLLVNSEVNMFHGEGMQSFLSIKISQLAPMIPYIVMVLMLIFRPQGLMGKRE